jgi:hypothetical protein
VPTLYEGDYVQQDLGVIAQRNGQDDADLLLAFLEELGCREDALWQLVRHRAERTYPSPTFNSRLIEWMLADRYNIGRIRPLPALSRYRILYGYDNEYDDIYSLAVVEKPPHGLQVPDYTRYYNYERDHPVSTRVIDEYINRQLPKIAGN